jgi:hypothetical protein
MYHMPVRNRASHIAAHITKGDQPLAARKNRLPADVIAADRALLLAIQSLSDYQPLNGAYSLAALQQAEATLSQAEQSTVRAEDALNQARAVEQDMAHFLHDIALGVKTQVIAQYGPDSTAVEIIGLTRKSDRKRPTKRKAA